MNLFEIVFSLIAGVGGISSVILAGIKFSSNIIAKNLENKYSLQLNKDLEEYKSMLENKSYISKAKFNLEIASYHELSKSFCLMIKEASLLIPAGFETSPADENEKKKKSDATFAKLGKRINEAHECLDKNSFLIPKKFENSYYEIIRLCNLQYRAYERRYIITDLRKDKDTFTLEEYKRTSEIQKLYLELIDNIRNYLNNLIVSD